MAEFITVIRLKDGVIHRIRNQYDEMAHAVLDAEQMMKEPERYLSIPDDFGGHTLFRCDQVSSIRIVEATD